MTGILVHAKVAKVAKKADRFRIRMIIMKRFTNTIFRTVPEPASWAMMIAGFGLVGGAMRRRKVSVTYA
jgi:PEP-CTERM motif